MASIEAILKPTEQQQQQQQQQIHRLSQPKIVDSDILPKSFAHIDSANLNVHNNIINNNNEYNNFSSSSSSSNSFVNESLRKSESDRRSGSHLKQKFLLSTPSLSSSLPFKSVKFNEESKKSAQTKLNQAHMTTSEIRLNEQQQNQQQSQLPTKAHKISQLTQLKNFLKSSSPKLNRANFSSLTRDSKKKKLEFDTLPKKRNGSVEGSKKAESRTRSPLPTSASDHNGFASYNTNAHTQSNTGRGNTCAKQIWKNDPQNFIRGGSYNFAVQYLGSSALTKIKTNQDPIKYTIDRLKVGIFALK